MNAVQEVECSDDVGRKESLKVRRNAFEKTLTESKGVLKISLEGEGRNNAMRAIQQVQLIAGCQVRGPCHAQNSPWENNGPAHGPYS